MKSAALVLVGDFLKENYRIKPVISIDPIPQGQENRNYFVKTESDTYSLRVYSKQHSTTGLRRRADIEFELDFMAHAGRQSVPTPIAIRALDGSNCSEIVVDGETRFAVLFSFIQGEHAQAYNPENARAIAETLLNLRKASQRYRYKTVRGWPGDIVKLSLEYYREHHGLNHLYTAELDALYTQADQSNRRLTDEALAVGVIHGDVKLENILCEGNTVKAVLDFDDFRESYLLEELARTVMHDLDSVERNVIRSGQFDQFRAVFYQDDSISGVEMGYLKTFLKARFLYDVSVYLQNGLTGLVEELFTDEHVASVILE